MGSKVNVTPGVDPVAFCEMVIAVPLSTETIVVPVGISVPVIGIPGDIAAVVERLSTVALPFVLPTMLNGEPLAATAALDIAS